MQLTAGVDCYTVPAMAALDRIWVQSMISGQSLMVAVIAEDEMAEDKRNAPLVAGMPRYACLSPQPDGTNLLVLFPTPDQDYLLTVRYAPPLVEI